MLLLAQIVIKKYIAMPGSNCIQQVPSQFRYSHPATRFFLDENPATGLEVLIAQLPVMALLLVSMALLACTL